jgi:Predicted membrane protein
MIVTISQIEYNRIMEKIKNNNIVIRFIKGFIIGASMLVPGASGGTMAIILGIYDELIHAVSTLRQNKKENALLLGEYAIAGIVGILLLSGAMLDAVTLWNKPMMFLFLGAILGSIPPLYRKVKVDRIRSVNIFVAALGALLGIATMYLPEGLFQLNDSFNLFNFLMLIIAGIIIAIALVLPGISASYILLMMGMYHLTLLAIKETNFLYLTPLAIGVLAGTFLTAGILEQQMHRHPQFTYMLIIGFMLGSLAQVFPGMPGGAEVVVCVITFAVGFFIILWLGRAKTV